MYVTPNGPVDHYKILTVGRILRQKQMGVKLSSYNPRSMEHLATNRTVLMSPSVPFRHL